MKTCEYCISEIDERASKCRFCGEWISDEYEGTEDKILNELAAIRKSVSIIVSLGIVIPILAGLLLLLLPR